MYKRQPPFTLKIVGFAYPSQGSLLNDFVTTAPAPARCNRSKTLSDMPKMPDARIVGLSRVRVPIEVERLAFTLNSLILFSYNS